MERGRGRSAMERIEHTLGKLVDLDRWLIDRQFPITNHSIDPLGIPWAPTVAANWPEVRRELDQLLADGIQMPDIDEVMGEELGAEGPWNTYILYSFGTWLDTNAARCPATAALIAGVPDLEIAGFTVLAGGTHLPRHRGPYRALRFQLGVKVPEPIGSCRLQVADEVIVWEDAKTLAFDDAVEHEAWNDSDEARYVLFIQTRWPLRGWSRPIHTLIHRVLAVAARSVPARAQELDVALNGWR